MSDLITAITTTISAIKTTLEIKKFVADTDSDLEKGKSNIQARELQEKLLDAEELLLKAKEQILRDDQRIQELEGKLRFKAKLVRQNSKYYEADENGRPISDPYCPRCWESEQKAIHLLPIEDEGDRFRCANCKNFFGKPKPRYSTSGFR